MAELSPTAAIAASRAGLPATVLIATGLRAVASRWPQALGFWAAGAALSLGERQLRAWDGLARASLSPAWLGTLALTAAGAAVLAALMLQLFLPRGDPWWRPDRRTWACAGLLAAAGVASAAVTLASIGKVDVGHLDALWLRQGLSFGTHILLWWIFARLMLWPIGVLMGDAGVTPGRSWRLMSGQVAGFVGAVILINLPLFLVGAAYPLMEIQAHRHAAVGAVRATALLTGLVAPALMVLQQAMAAAVYRAKAAAGAARR